MKETYEIQVICHNCHHVPRLEDEAVGKGQYRPDIPGDKPSLFFDVPKGIEVQKFLIGMTCENCGCDGFMGLN